MNNLKIINVNLDYNVTDDSLYISFSDKKSSIGDEDYKPGVFLMREPNTNKIVGIEIWEISKFRSDYIQIGDYQKLYIREIIDAFKSFHDLYIKWQKLGGDPDEFFTAFSQVFNQLHVQDKSKKFSPSPLRLSYEQKISQHESELIYTG